MNFLNELEEIILELADFGQQVSDMEITKSKASIARVKRGLIDHQARIKEYKAKVDELRKSKL